MTPTLFARTSLTWGQVLFFWISILLLVIPMAIYGSTFVNIGLDARYEAQTYRSRISSGISKLQYDILVIQHGSSSVDVAIDRVTAKKKRVATLQISGGSAMLLAALALLLFACWRSFHGLAGPERSQSSLNRTTET